MLKPRVEQREHFGEEGMKAEGQEQEEFPGLGASVQQGSGEGMPKEDRAPRQG